MFGCTNCQFEIIIVGTTRKIGQWVKHCSLGFGCDHPEEKFTHCIGLKFLCTNGNYIQANAKRTVRTYPTVDSLVGGITCPKVYSKKLKIIVKESVLAIRVVSIIFRVKK